MSADSPQTQDLLNRARQGDKFAVDQLLAVHRDSLRRAVQLRLDPALAGRIDASDVVQDALFEVSRRLSEYLQKPDMPFHLWIRHIARDHVIDAHRKHRQAQRRSVDRERSIQPGIFADQSSIQLAAQFIDQELTPASAAVRQEIERRLQQAVSALDEEDRELILMRHFEQLSNQEIAKLLGLSEPAASMRYLRAVRRLRGLLES
jgi:RNA polymerase sigma-70 factor (ECF subfamily)